MRVFAARKEDVKVPISRNIRLSYTLRTEPARVEMRLTLPPDMDKQTFDDLLDRAEEKVKQTGDSDWFRWMLREAGVSIVTNYVSLEESIEDIDYEEVIDDAEKRA